MNGEPCELCGSAEETVFGPDPFAEEIHDDTTPMWLCQGCWQESALDI